MRRCVTLIELLVVIAIIALMAGTIGINIKRAVSEQRFLTEVRQVVDQLRTAQELMLLAKAEVKIDFQRGEHGYFEMNLQCDDEIPKGWESLLCRKSILRYIEDIECEQELRFFSRGSVMTRGIITLSAGEKRYIALQGYPAPIDAAKERPTLLEMDLHEIKEITITDAS